MKQQVKVLYVGMDSCMGGIESFIINVFRKIDNSKVKIDFLKFQDKICFEEEINDRGSTVFQLPPRRKNPFKFYSSLFCFFKNHPEYGVVHVHLNTCSCIAPAVIAKLYGRKVIVHSHNEWKGDRKLVKILDSINKKFIPFFSDKMLACSDLAGKWMFKNHAYTVVNNGIDTSKYAYNPAQRGKIRKSLDIDNKLVIGNVGRLSYQKNHDFLIDIFNEIFKKNSSAILLLIGSGELELQLKRKVSNLNLDNAVLFLGVRSDIPELLQAMDVFLFPSFFEGLGIVAIEAQAAGLPCIVSDAIPQEAFVTDLVESISLNESAEKWAEEINKFYYSNIRRNTSKEIIEAGYDIQKTAKELEELYLML